MESNTLLYHVYMDDKELFDIIGHNIKIERTIRRLTQEQLAELIDVQEEKYIRCN